MAMRRAAWQRFLMEPSHRLVGVFLVFILLPGIVLGVFALRTLRQEGRLAQQQIQERLERITAQIGRDLDLEFTQWQNALESTVKEAMAEPISWPEIVREGVEAPGSGVIIWLDGKKLQAFPSGQLLYTIADAPAPITEQPALPSSIAQAESLELSQKDYPRAIRSYQKLLDSSGAPLQAYLLHRLARSYHKASRLDDAVRAYQKLASLNPTYIGKLPSDLIARSELCAIAAERRDPAALAANALEMYSNLSMGRWRLEKTRYFYYSDQLRSWLKDSATTADNIKTIEKLEERKLALAEAVEELLVEPKRLLFADTAVCVAFWQKDPLRAIVLSGDFLGSRLWPRVVLPADDDGLDAVLYSPDDRVVFGSPPEGVPSLSLTRTVQLAGAPFRIQVWPREPDALYADLKNRQHLYMATLIFVVALLVFGSYITARTVRRELEVARMRADFVSTVSHEFRSPLTGIRQLAEMLLHGRVPGAERQRRYHKMILQESERLARLVENLLDFSRMEEGRKEYRLAPLNTSVWLRELAGAFQSEIAENGISVVANIPEDLPSISADGEALECAVHNLLDNAVKYSPGSQTVWLDAAAGNGNVTISVRDRGVGIGETDRKHIFDRFYRVDGEISRKVKGAGLGLSLVRHIVAAHGGGIKCESRVGEGSRFSIRIPIAPSLPEG
jgi:signal transduction histidine kinase/tetratricopeptide (TPR) repeat protein